MTPTAAGKTPREILAAAVHRATERVPALSASEPERAAERMLALQVKLEDVLAGADANAVRTWLEAEPGSETLLEAVVAQLLDAPEDSDAAVPTLRALRACLAVRPKATRIDEGPSPDGDDGLEGRMRGPGAYELLVEVAHDFRSPLTSILFLAEALRDGHSGPVTDLQRSQLGLIYSAAFGLASVASDVMDLARRERDLISGEPEPFPLAEVFGSVERLVRPLVEEKHLELRVVVPDRFQAHGHPHALSRVLLNLTTNALKFTDEGFVEIGVQALPHGRLEYYVQDTGRGITPEQQQELFQPFKHRSGKQEGHYFSGSGVGLSIARRLLRAMGTDLSLDSSDAKGTRFSFILGTPIRSTP